MAELAGVLQQLSQGVIEGMKLTDMAVGTVVSASPLSVQADSAMPPIPEKALSLTDAVIARTAKVQGGAGGTVVIHDGLKTGDKVLMLRVKNGQNYIILSKIKGG